MNEIKEFSFSNISLRDLKSIVDIEKQYDLSVFKIWFQDREIGKSDLEFLENHNKRFGENMTSFFRNVSRETIQAKVIVPILNQVNFYNFESKISDFYSENIQYFDDEFILKGVCDFIVGTGLIRVQTPYFFIQEFKKTQGSNPEPQLIAEMISGLEISKFEKIRGAFIIGSIWNFVILWKENGIYKYVISQNFDVTKFEDLKKIFQNLLFVKNEILDLVKTEKILKERILYGKR